MIWPPGLPIGVESTGFVEKNESLRKRLQTLIISSFVYLGLSIYRFE
jgi:hypothetical protein